MATQCELVFSWYLQFLHPPKFCIDSLNEELAQSLIDACATGELSQLKTLFERSQKYPAPSMLMESYLGEAARRSSPDMLNLLLKHGSQIEGSQALGQAVQYGQIHNAEILLKHGADVNEVYIDTKYVPRKYK